MLMSKIRTPETNDDTGVLRSARKQKRYRGGGIGHSMIVLLPTGPADQLTERMWLVMVRTNTKQVCWETKSQERNRRATTTTTTRPDSILRSCEYTSCGSSSTTSPCWSATRRRPPRLSTGEHAGVLIMFQAKLDFALWVTTTTSTLGIWDGSFLAGRSNRTSYKSNEKSKPISPSKGQVWRVNSSRLLSTGPAAFLRVGCPNVLTVLVGSIVCFWFLFRIRTPSRSVCLVS